jgi:hypothetical protein
MVAAKERGQRLSFKQGKKERGRAKNEATDTKVERVVPNALAGAFSHRLGDKPI